MNRRWKGARLLVIVPALLCLTLALDNNVVLTQEPVQITITLVDEAGTPLANYPPPGDSRNLQAKYRYGGTWAPWQPFTTDGNGQFVMQIAPEHMSRWDGKVTVVLHQNTKEQSVTQQGPNIFQTARVNVNLKSCGQLIQEDPGGTVSQGGGYWYTHGTTGLTGTVTFYTFPGSVKLKMTYKGTSETKESVPIGLGTNEVDFIVPCTTGTIVIVKDAVPNDPQDFEFSRSFGANFFLDDDTDNTLPNTETFGRLAPGSYTVTELGPPAGWTLTGLVCTDLDNGSTVDVDTRTATIDLDAEETVTCTFTNKTHDLAVTKSDDVDPATINQLVTYTITVTNNGPSTAPNVVVTDTLEASGVTLISVTPSQGGPCTIAANVITCPLGTIANGNSATVTLQVLYTTTGTKTNTVSASDTLPDLDTSNNLNRTETTSVTQSFYRDDDGDGYGNPNDVIQAYEAPQGYVNNGNDCDDNNSSIYPGATEVCNGVDDNCNGDIDEGCAICPPIVTNCPVQQGKVGVIALPSRLWFRDVSSQNVIMLTVINRSANPITVQDIQALAALNIVKITPALPRVVGRNQIKIWTVWVRGKGPFPQTVTKPYLNVTIVCPPGQTVVPTSQQPLELESVGAVQDENMLMLWANGQGIASVQLQLYSLTGRLLVDRTSEGSVLTMPLTTDNGRRLANGVYLYVVTVRGYDGQVVRSEIRKLVIMR